MRAFFILFLVLFNSVIFALPQGFVYLHSIDPSIFQEIRYHSYHNFVGRPIEGYATSQCILTLKAANALAAIQKELQASGMSLKVYDCYRPTRAVADFINWSQNQDEKMKPEFYPTIDKIDMFKLGYVATQSSHSRGSTVDLTIVKIPLAKQANYIKGQALVACTAPYQQRYQDNSIDMGTGYDCMHELSHGLNQKISPLAFKNRMLLRNLMEKYDFQPYDHEWWHFTLKDEPYPHQYFNFVVK